jgi:anthranilate phosphoribosyltransferase
MSQAFRTLLKKIGSGPHTGQSLSRAEAAEAARMMLTQAATPAQIGAFLIAHRIRRPTGEELAGMLDAYAELGPSLLALDSPRPVMVLGNPYDGRSRTVPIGVITALLLAAADCPVVMHGGDRLPTKYGIPLVANWQSLGVDWTGLSLEQVQHMLELTGVGFVYLPRHFPLAQGLVQYREEIGKRPPLATLELMWSPYAGPQKIMAGYVHPPTEGMIRTALTLRGQSDFVTVKGLEGSCDLPRERPCILGLGNGDHIVLHPHDYGLGGKNPELEEATCGEALKTLVQAKTWVNSQWQPYTAQPKATVTARDEPTAEPTDEPTSEALDPQTNLMRSVLWNGGFYLWQSGATNSLEEGLKRCVELLRSGAVEQKLVQIQAAH